MVYFPQHHRLSIFPFFCVGNLFPGRNYCDVSCTYLKMNCWKKPHFILWKVLCSEIQDNFLQSPLPCLRVVMVFLSSSGQVLDHISGVTTSKYFQFFISQSLYTLQPVIYHRRVTHKKVVKKQFFFRVLYSVQPN